MKPIGNEAAAVAAVVVERVAVESAAVGFEPAVAAA